jgi:hypothetical protein
MNMDCDFEGYCFLILDGIGEALPQGGKSMICLPTRNPLRNVLSLPGALNVPKWEFLC